jgi:hypothetical protein
VKTKPITPYARLKKSLTEWATNVVYPHRQTMWIYPTDKLQDKWSLVYLNQRVLAAQQIGYEVRLVATDEGLRVDYVKARPSDLPWELRS